MLSWPKLPQALSAIWRYAATLLAVICTLAIRLALDPMLGDRAAYMFFFLAIVVVKRLWGRGPALLATLLGGIAAWYFIIEPRFSFAIGSPADALNLAAYFAVGVGISFLGEVSGRSLVARAVGKGSTKLRIIRQSAVLAGAAVILAGMVLLLLRDFARAQEAEGWVVHTYRVINSAETLLSTLTDAETGERGYLLTGDERYLAPYNAAITAIPQGLKELKEFTSDNPAQQARWAEINRLTGERLSVLKHAIALRNVNGGGTSMALVRFGRGEPAMDELRSTLDAVVAEERRLLVERTTEAEIRASRGRWVLGLGSAALVLLLVFASVVIERETTRREEITEALRRHADLLDQTHDSLLTCRLGGAIEYWNHGAENLYGYSRQEALGHVSYELLHTSHPHGIAQICSQVERDGEWKGELTQIAKDGRKLTVEGQWTLAVDAEGHKMVLEANRDITERKRAEAENLLLATAIEQALETVVVTDRQGKIQYANPAFTRTTGYTHEEALGQNPRILKSGQHDAKFYQELWATLTAGKLWHGEFTNRRKDGTLYVEEATLAPVRNAAGEITNYIAIKSDITARKQVEKAQREGEMMLRFFVQFAPAAIAMLDQEMRYIEVSRRWMADYHLPDRDIRGLSHYEVFPEVPERWKEIHRRCLAGGVERCEEDPFPRQDGEIDWVRWEVRPWRRFDDSIGGIIIFSEVITERVRAEEALRESESRERARAAEFEALMDAAPVGIFRSDDPECRSMSGNQAAYDLLRRPRGSNLSKSGPEGERPVNFRALQGGREIPLLDLPMQKAAATGQTVRNSEMDFVFDDGVTVNVQGDAVPLLDESGRPRGAIGTFADITERKRVEKALAESELRYRQLFERSESALAVYEMIFDAQGKPRDFRYVNVNPAFERITGRVAERILGRTAREITPEIEDYWIQLFGRVAATGEPATFEHYAQHLERFYAGSAYTPRPHQVAVTFMDVTERKQAEEQLRLLNLELEQRVRERTAALEMANRELEAFAHSVSHDLRAPLRGIDGWSLALLEDCGDRLDAQGKEYLDRVRSEAQRMGRLIDDILNLSRVTRGEMVSREVDLSQLAETVAARLHETHRERAIEFTVSPGLKCTGDARLLEVALTNLFDNAVKFTAPRAIARVEFGKTESEGHPCYFVRDNGVGFDMAYARMLFAPFQRLHRTSEFPGTGIGLATVQRVIHRHGGRIWAEAQVGKGAIFYFSLGENKS
jgi:PAS domain S-box-containing protein